MGTMTSTTRRGRCVLGWFCALALAWLPSFLRVAGVAASGAARGLEELKLLPVLFHLVLALLPYDFARDLLSRTALTTSLYWLGVVIVGAAMQSVYRVACKDSNFSKGLVAALAWSAVIAASPLAHYLPSLVQARGDALLALILTLMFDSVMIFVPFVVVLGLVSNALASLLLRSWRKMRTQST